MGSWIPAKDGAQTTPGQFNALVGCNDCKDPGWALTEPAFLQTWMDDGTTLKLTKNVSVSFTGSPATFTAAGFGFQPDGAVRTKDGNLLITMYGYAKDAPVAKKYTTCVRHDTHAHATLQVHWVNQELRAVVYAQSFLYLEGRRPHVDVCLSC